MPGVRKDAIEKRQVLIYNWFYDVTAERSAPPDHFHSELVAAVVGDRPEIAARMMRRHVRYGLDGIIEAVEYHIKADDWRVKR